MKHCILLHILLLSVNSYSQQWIDKKYTYDSVLNIEYGKALNFAGGTDTLLLDLYLPTCKDSSNTSRKPLLIWIHGGAFLVGDKNDVSIQDLCKQFAKRGYVTASIGYRLGFISDDAYWQCNYPNYSCVFAADSSEWVRSYYRAMQDGKGALRYLINRNEQYKIDTNNVFVAGESAGAFVALAIALLDTAIERPIQTFSIANTALPHNSNLNCSYNKGKIFSGLGVSRPDLGDIHGTIEPSNIAYTIKGVGNMYGAMYSDLLKLQKANKQKPAIYSFHQPCDIVVPIDSNFVYWGLSWCFTNGYNCNAITNNQAKLYGSRVISNWNTTNNYGYTIQNEFTTTNFPYSFLLGSASCADQINTPCHAYDNKKLRENNLAAFFSKNITTSPTCDSVLSPSLTTSLKNNKLLIYPNPAKEKLFIALPNSNTLLTSITIYNQIGKICFELEEFSNLNSPLPIQELSTGLYILKATYSDNSMEYLKLQKQ